MKYAIAIVLLCLVLAGCGSGKVRQTVTAETGEKVVVTGTPGEKSWCPAGGDWAMTTNAQQGASATMKVDKIMTSGKYAGMCHVVYTWTSEDGSGKWDYYFNEDKKTGYLIMDINGQHIEQAIQG